MIVSCAIASHDKGISIKRESNFPHWTCAYMKRGELNFKSSGDHIIIESESVLVIPPNTPYIFKVSEADEHIWAIFDSSIRISNYLETLKGGIFYELLQDCNFSKEITESFQETYKWWTTEPIRVALAENSLERVFLLLAEIKKGTHIYGDPRISKVIKFITDNLTKDINVPELAYHINLSPSRFAALFREKTGLTPAKYIESTRLEEACNLLLSTDSSISEIAEEVGYKNAFHFSTRFSKYFEQCPRDFRKKPSRRRYEIIPH